MSEIEELRAEFDKLLDDFLKECEQSKQLKLENDRLREELTELKGQWERMLENYASADARAALAKEVPHD